VPQCGPQSRGLRSTSFFGWLVLNELLGRGLRLFDRGDRSVTESGDEIPVGRLGPSLT
jgi:hypothetical protein